MTVQRDGHRLFFVVCLFGFDFVLVRKYQSVSEAERPEIDLDLRTSRRLIFHRTAVNTEPKLHTKFEVLNREQSNIQNMDNQIM
jgi:hypothetical protein